jgi:hypothetical protein
MYQAYPGGDQPSQGFTPTTPTMSSMPQSVARAVKVMYAGAAASLIGVIVDLTAIGPLRDQIRTHDTKNGKPLTTAQVNTLVHLELAAFIVVGLITVGLWIWMARGAAAGKNWARITSTVFFALATISTLTSLAGSLTSGGAARFYGILVWLIGLVAIVLLWQRTSSDYFRGTPRY